MYPPDQLIKFNDILTGPFAYIRLLGDRYAIEKLTKKLGPRVLATREVAALAPHLWHSIGEHALEGVGQPQELFGLREEAAAAEAA